MFGFWSGALELRVQQQSTAAKSDEDVSKSPQRVTCRRRAGVGVDLDRDRLVCMPQDSHDHARMHIEVDEQRCTRVPGIMNSDRTHARGLATNCLLRVRGSIGVP
jgi:hypothetical protein